MNSPIRNDAESGLGWVIGFAAVAAALTFTLGGCSCSKDPAGNGNGTTQGPGGESEDHLVKLAAALAATENIEPEQAETYWSELRSHFADDPSVALNRALNSVLWVDALTTQATESVKSDEEKKAARSRLPSAIEAARAAIEAYSTNSGDEVTKLWLNCRIDHHEATLLGTTIGKSLQRELFAELTSAIDGPTGADPKAAILGGPLIELIEQMSDPIDGLPQNILIPASHSLKRLSDQNPDNLFLALRALRLAVDRQDASAVDLVDRSWQLARAVEPTLAAFTKPIGFSPQELTERIRDAINRNDWAAADQSTVLWTNVLNPLEIVRTDRRRCSPHPLDRLSFDTLRRLSTQIAGAQPVAADEAELRFDDETISGNASIVLPVDADLDLQMDLISISTTGMMTLHQRGDTAWTTTAELQLPVQPSGAIVADLFMVDSSDAGRLKRTGPTQSFDSDQPKSLHDTLPGVILYGPFGAQVIQIDSRSGTAAADRLSLVTETTGLEDLTAVETMAVGDLEGDGDLDLIVAPAAGSLRVWINRGNRTFFEAEIGTSGIDANDAIVDLSIADLDRDIDLDVVALHHSGRISLLENLLHLQFRTRYLDDIPALSVDTNDRSMSIAVEDVDSNVGWDVVATSSKQSMVAFGNSSDIGVWTIDRVETGPGFQSRPQLADFDNDSYLEWIGSGETLKLGPWGINVLSPSPVIAPSRSAIASADFNHDGRIDLVAVDQDAIQIAINQSATSSHHISVRFKGIADNAAASGRVNHYAIGSVLELRFGPYYRSRIVRSPVTHFGIDGFDSVGNIRVIMPNGLTQSIRNPAVDTNVQEEQTLKGSCPYLYAWDGEKFAFATDCLWAAPLGLQVAAGVVQRDRPWEYLKIDGDLVGETSDGKYELRLTEELWEVAYVDQVELVAVDHPADVTIYTNEKVGPPDLALPTIYSFSDKDLHPVINAIDGARRDVTSLISKSDEQYVQGFDRRLRQGLCEPHWIDLDFGDPVKQRLQSRSAESVYLVLRGWILPTDTSLNIQIDQNPELPPIEFPSVWVPESSDPTGWRKAIPFMGFPGGKTKTIVVDVTDQIQNHDPRLRIRTSAQIYWDSAALAIQERSAPSMTQAVALVDAEVAFHGFSTRIKPDATRPETYLYDQADLQPKWPPLHGWVTEQGDCTERLAAWDDSMVVISGGDEIRMRFQPPDRTVPTGWKRDFVLHCVGWDKDADLNTLTGQSIGPLPIRDMSDYPPTMASTDRFAAVERLNSDSLRRRQSFRAFWNRDGIDKPPFQFKPTAP